MKRIFSEENTISRSTFERGLINSLCLPSQILKITRIWLSLVPNCIFDSCIIGKNQKSPCTLQVRYCIFYLPPLINFEHSPFLLQLFPYKTIGDIKQQKQSFLNFICRKIKEECKLNFVPHTVVKYFKGLFITECQAVILGW